MGIGIGTVSAGNPLDHVLDYAYKQIPAATGLLTPNGEITLLSSHIVMLILSGLLLIFFMPRMVRKMRGEGEIDRLVPTGSANAIETICQFWRDEVARPNLGEHTDRFIKYIWSVFFFVLTINILGLLPIQPLAALGGIHLGGAATGNIWVTATLAILTLLLMVVNGLRFGGKDYVAHFCPGPLWLAPILVPVEIIGLLAKTFALAVRLFANMIAGHILLAVLVGFIISAWSAMGAGGGLAVAVPVVLASVGITLLELFVAFLQAFIFTFLTTLFIGMSVNVHHDDEHEEAAAH
jgi:F-type H+-transporting ATPase subunit a